MSECKRCGKCCECIVLAYSSEYIKEVAAREVKHSNFNFAYRNFRQITQERAYLINPYLKNWSKNQTQYFYTCRRFDPITRICKVYSARPQTCSGFPWYGKIPAMQPLYSLDCGYHEDLKNLKKSKLKKFEVFAKKSNGKEPELISILKKALRTDK
jgi:Fe-S-cluster containining protein